LEAELIYFYLLARWEKEVNEYPELSETHLLN
jgi:hypothetical protein